MPVRTLASNVSITGPLASPSLKVNGPKVEATCTVTFTAPPDPTAFLAGSVETNDGTGWIVQQNFQIGGGPSKTGGVNHPVIAQGLAQYDGLSIRMEIISVFGTGWIVDSVILDW